VAPFGRQSLIGIVVKKHPTTDPSEAPKTYQLKQISSSIDQEPIFSQDLLTLGFWLSHYYIHPLGEVLRTMLPLGTQKKTRQFVKMTPKGYDLVHRRQKEWLLLSEIFRTPCIDPQATQLPLVSKTTLLSRLHKYLCSQLHSPESWCWQLLSPKTSERSGKGSFQIPEGYQDEAALKLAKAGDTLLRALSRRGLVKLSRSTDHQARSRPPAVDPSGTEDLQQPTQTKKVAPKPPLTSDQREVLTTLLWEGYQGHPDRVGQELTPAHKVFLLHGVTGSGKTEIYLNLIESLLESPSHSPYQILVMVPEISLTPQMTGVFSQRFPDLVAVVHSAMPDQKRWAQLEKIRTGVARVLIGPRSAVFGPFQNLGLMIVDEEHDSSYKQDTGLCYHGRDVAVVRGKIHNIPVLLGSATPSLESYANALDGRYQLLKLPERVGTATLPEVTMVSIENPSRYKPSPLQTDRQDPHHVVTLDLDSSLDTTINPVIIQALQETLDKGEQSIILVNRRGFASYLKSMTTGKSYQCPQCSIAMTLHRKTQLLRCHYCDQNTSVAQILRDHPDQSYGSVGYGSQKIEDLIGQLIPLARLARLDSDTMTGDRLAEVLGQFRQRQLDILVGTQMLAKGHDFPKVTLVVLLEVDQLLNIPDFRAGEKTFQLIVQAAGRAGRSSTPGRVIMQAQQHLNPIVLAAAEQNYPRFLEIELAQRKSLLYPPYSRMIRFCFESKNQQKLTTAMGELNQWLQDLAQKDPEAFSQLRVLGPSVPAIERLREAYRQMLLLVAPVSHLKKLKNLGALLAHSFQNLPHGVGFSVDVDPINLM
jgi:primosomal protein N' (replication factor Y)